MQIELLLAKYEKEHAGVEANHTGAADHQSQKGWDSGPDEELLGERA